jgi:membrane-bound lytic murein transglycosylase
LWRTSSDYGKQTGNSTHYEGFPLHWGVARKEVLLMKRWVLIIVALFLAATALGCGKKEEAPQVKKPVTEKQVQQDTKQALETLKAYTEQQKEEYQKKVADQVAEIKKKVEEMKGQFDKAAPELKTRLEKEMAEANKDLGALQKNLAEMKTATGKAWEDMKSSVNQALQDLQKSPKSEKEGK